MRSIISSAIVASAVLGQTAYAATVAHRHTHAHLHDKKSEKRGISVANVLANAGVVTTVTPSAAITEDDSGPFKVEFSNDSNKDIVVVTWSGANGEATWTSMCVNVNAPSHTVPLSPGETALISINPSAVGGSISGGFAALYPITNLIEAGSINNTWAEWTFTTANQFSAVDVSRLVNMAGNHMSIETYASYPASGDALCVSDMENCVFTCNADASGSAPNSCETGYTLQNCEGANTQNFGGTSGGCGGFTAEGGYTKISFKP